MTNDVGGLTAEGILRIESVLYIQHIMSILVVTLGLWLWPKYLDANVASGANANAAIVATRRACMAHHHHYHMHAQGGKVISSVHLSQHKSCQIQRFGHLGGQ